MAQAFKVLKNGKQLDYRKSEILDLDEVKTDFSKKFEVTDIRQPGRHVIGNIRKNGKDYILKLASTEGISARTEIEAIWNDEFNKYSKSSNFRVPKNFEQGYYNGLFYLIVEKFKGTHLSTLRGGNNIVSQNIQQIIGFAEHIQTLQLDIPNDDLIQAKNAQEWFVEKTKSLYESVNEQVIQEYEVKKLLEIVEREAESLSEKPRHGDFTPWHMIALNDGALALIDGEHAHSHGIQDYDIAYFIQRVFSVIDRSDQAEEILLELTQNNYDLKKLKTVLISRAIGGFCDEYLSPVPNFEKAKEFSEFVMQL